MEKPGEILMQKMAYQLKLLLLQDDWSNVGQQQLA